MRSLTAAALLTVPAALVLTQVHVRPTALNSAMDSEAGTAVQRVDNPGQAGGALDLRPVVSGPAQEGPEGTVLDVSLADVSTFTQVGRTGTYPDGRVAFAANTVSCNSGNIKVPWFAAMDANHPFIELNLYRVNAAGTFEQIGVSWVKHGFYAADAPGFGCGSCQPNPFDDYLQIGCTDTYAVGNNSDRAWLGPRSEVNALTGVWNPCGSFFDLGYNGTNPDCLRSYDGRGEAPTNHLLDVADGDLGVAGARYFYEGYYVVKDDQKVYNNVGWREATFSYNSGTGKWGAGNVTTRKFGPAVMSWGDMQNMSTNRDEGDAIVACRQVDLGGGRWRYEYVVYNHNLPRDIQSFSVPICGSADVSNISFHQPIEDEDIYSTDDWRATVTGSSITWATDPYNVNPEANPIRFGTCYTFAFECAQAPGLSTAAMNLYEPGTLAAVNASIFGPDCAGSQSGLYLTATTIIRDWPLTLTAAGARPGEKVYFVYSTEGLGRTNVAQIGLDLDLQSSVVQVGTATANAQGVATLQLHVPGTIPVYDNIGIQALVARGGGGSLKSNVILSKVSQ